MDAVQLSDSQHKEHHMKGDHALLTDVSGSVSEVAFSFCVCV